MRARISFLMLLIYSIGFSQPVDYKFEHLSIADGLSHNSITSIIQDHKGLLWIGTSDGLNLYDGYSFRIFRASAFDSGSISSNKITKLYEDNQNILWIGTRNGLNYFDWTSYSFKQVSFNKFVNRGARVFIKSIFEDKNSNLWIGTYGHGLYLYEREQGALKKIPLEYGAPPVLSAHDEMVSDIFEDSRGNFWVATSRTGLIRLKKQDLSAEFLSLDPGNKLPSNTMVKTIYEDREGILWICSELAGLFRVQPATFEVKNYQYSPDRNSLSNNIVKDIFQDDNGLLWLATDGGGINIMDKNTEEFRVLNYNIAESSGLSTNAIYTLYRDNRDIIWIGTFGGGINILDPNKKPFYHFTQKENDPNSLSHPSVLSFTEDRNGIIWIGTDGGGLNRFDPETEKFSHYLAEPGKPGALSNNAVTSVFEDSYGNLWVGTFSGGLNLFERNSEKFFTYRKDENDPRTIANNNVWVLYETRNRQLLIGTLGGLDLLDRNNMRFIHLSMKNDPNTSSYERILALREDSEGQIWIGSNGLWKMNFRDTSIVQVPLIIDNDTLSWDYDVREVFEDSRGILWVGTEGGGLLRYNSAESNFTIYTVEQGLPNNVVHEIQEDAYGFLWISTNGGLSKFDPETREFRNYDNSDGLQSNQFSYSASLMTENGTMYFGGVNGFNRFNPAAIKDNKYVPPVIFTDFKLFNRPVEIGAEDSPLKTHISETRKIVLRHDQSVLTFEFASLNYSSSRKNQYQFIMEGFEDEWNRVGQQRSATYTNLDPGDYLLRVRGSNNDGIWNTTGTSLEITVLPPLWKTKAAFIFYGIFILFLLYSFRRYAITRAHMKNELKLKDLEKQKIQEVNQMKMQFFTNISHEFRTPLTLILSPLEKLMSSENRTSSQGQLYKLMYRNASRLLSLINQLMDLRKIEKGSMDLKLSRQDIVGFVKEIKTAFDELAEEKHMEFSFSSNIPNMKIWFDADKIDKIIYNLLSNAFKFTPDEKKITVKIKLKTKEQIRNKQPRKLIKKERYVPDSLEGGYIEISVKDNGIGISKDKQDKIFTRFYQVKNELKTRNSGTGIGLSLSRDLALLHKGDLQFLSAPDKGSKFSLLLPIDEKVYSRDEFIDEKQQGIQHPEIAAVLDEKYSKLNEEVTGENNGNEKKSMPSILIVEDNSDVRNFIRISLEPVYKIYESEDGEQGIKVAQKIIPDIIISDIMMPVMDGIEMAGRLHCDPACSHIPIIFLTAKTAEQSRMKGMETGVVDYINKPFNPRILALKVKNIIENRKNYAERIRKALILEPSEIEIESMDEKFIKKAREIVEKYISEPEFDVQKFVSEMGMSRSVLYRKLRAVTNQSANEFINVIRLKRAAQLLGKNTMNVSEISYMVGFNDPQYFSKCFRKQYGKTPSQYANSPA